MTRRLVHTGRLVDLALVLAAAVLIGPIAYVALHPLFAPRYRHVGKIELRAIAPVTEALR